jgi:hypothetical protein
VGVEVPEFGDGLEVVVDGLAAAVALVQDLPVFEPGDVVFDVGSDPAVCAVVVIANDPAGGSAWRCGDGGDAAVAAVAEDDSTGEQLRHGVAGHDDVVVVTGLPQRGAGERT